MAEAAEHVRREYANLGERASEVWRRASQVTQEAGAVSSAVKEVLDDTVDTVKRQARNLRFVPDEVAYRVRRSPLRAVGGAMVAGVVLGAAIAWLTSAVLHAQARNETAGSGTRQ